MNVVILRGVLSRPAEQRVLPSGDTLIAYEVRTANVPGPAESVPVVWPAAPERALFSEGQAVVVTGRVRRRFYRAAGATQSRTEVVADAVIRASDVRRVRRVVEHAIAVASPP
jgi:single-strand DNA-binding protein